MKLDVGLEVMIALGTLSERDREVVVDRVVLGRSLGEVAADVGLSKQGVANCERRALSQLRARLQAMSIDEAPAA